MYSMPVIGEPHASHALIRPKFRVRLASSPFGRSPVASFVRTIALRSRGWSDANGTSPEGGPLTTVDCTAAVQAMSSRLP